MLRRTAPCFSNSINHHQHHSMLYDSIVDTVGRTPIVKLQRLANAKKLQEEGKNVYVKLEYFNPLGSVKDRLAVGIMDWAEQNKMVQPGQTVVEASSGNTGIGMAMVCAARGYPFVSVMSESFSIERRKLMRMLGAKVILTNPAHKGSGMVIKAKELADKHGWFWPNQFEAQANADIHRRTTGPEILQAFQNVPLHHFVCAYGTGGTINGVGQYLRQESPTTKLHVCEPDNAPLLFSNVKTTYPSDGIPSTSFLEPHPSWRPHLFQGWATDFIPKLVAQAQELNLIDSVRHVGGDEAIQMCKELAAKEGILSGPSGGGIVACALALAEECPPGTNILALIPDTGERYLSTPLFESISADMTEEEKELAASTPSLPPPVPGLPSVVPEAVEFVHKMNRQHTVVVWSLQYCEFCWTLTRFLDALGVPYEQINIDNFEFAKDNMGNKYRAALSEQTGCNTFPQLFVNNSFLGGAVDACVKWKKDELQPLLDQAGLNKDNFNGYKGDPFEFLPKWMTQNPHRTK